MEARHVFRGNVVRPLAAVILGGLLVALVMAGPAAAPGPKPCPQLTGKASGGTLGAGGEILSPCPGGPVKLTYFGSAGDEYGKNIGFDAAGNVYVGAYANTATLPTTAGAYDTTYNGGADVWVGKFDTNLTTLIWGTYIGGPGFDTPQGMAVALSGEVYLTGIAGAGFPVTSGAFDTSHNGGNDAFVAVLDSTGASLLYASFLGGSGSDNAHSIALEAPGIVYVTGGTGSTDFPTTAGAFDTTFNGDPAAGSDVFVSKMSLQGAGAADLVYSTYLGGTAGSESDEGRSIVVLDGYAYVGGWTRSTDFPTTPGAFDRTRSGTSTDGFLTKLNPSGSGLVYSTFLGGTGTEVVYGVAADGAGQAHVTGYTDSTGFPTTPGAWDLTRSGIDAFVTKFNAAGSGLLYSTFLGGKSQDQGRGIRLTVDGSAFISGFTQSSNFPVTADAYDGTYNGGQDVILTRLSAAGSGLVYSSYLGGSGEESNYDAIAVDANERVYLSGRTQSSNFPTSSGAYDTTYDGGWDGFIAALD